jgi:gluconokinase
MSLRIVLMGVSGCGKTTVGHALADALGCPFYDGDDFQPEENITKMAGGVPLTDADRWPWLERLHTLLQEHARRDETAVLACSALRKGYRDRLRAGIDGVRIVHLRGEFDLIYARMQERPGHYMKPDLLRSQFEALEPPAPEEAFILDIAEPVETIVRRIRDAVGTVP